MSVLVCCSTAKKAETHHALAMCWVAAAIERDIVGFQAMNTYAGVANDRWFCLFMSTEPSRQNFCPMQCLSSSYLLHGYQNSKTSGDQWTPFDVNVGLNHRVQALNFRSRPCCQFLFCCQSSSFAITSAHFRLLPVQMFSYWIKPTFLRWLYTEFSPCRWSWLVSELVNAVTSMAFPWPCKLSRWLWFLVSTHRTQPGYPTIWGCCWEIVVVIIMVDGNDGGWSSNKRRSRFVHNAGNSISSCAHVKRCKQGRNYIISKAGIWQP